ncbi:MAG: ABC transporter ATP-binding protein [Lachnospiraceae bacterium]
MACIEVNSLTKDYGYGRGVFDISLSVEQGETFGFAGINGAGKTTTIRQLMGFLRPESGQASIRGMDCWRNSARIKRLVSYVPGEIAFPDDGSGETFLKRHMEMAGQGDMEYCQFICDQLQLDITANLKSMSKGMKQKTAIVAALMRNAEILIMDEPTTGLDPLMREVFLELLDAQKAMGRTIFMSSHIFEEMERTCDRVALIKDGKIVTIANMNDIRHNKDKSYKIEFKDESSYKQFSELGYNAVNIKPDHLQLTVNVNDNKIGRLVNDLTTYDILFFKEIKHSLEEYFHEIFKEESDNV